MTVLNKEMKENRRVELTIRVERQEWQQALDDAYQANRDLYPVDGCAPGKATRQALEQAYAPDVFYQEAPRSPGPWWRPSAGRRSWWPGPRSCVLWTSGRRASPSPLWQSCIRR